MLNLRLGGEPAVTETDYALRRRLALTRCQLVHNLGPGYAAGCCLCQRWADVFRGDPEPPPEPVECCASGRCEVCTPGFVWGRDG